MSPEGNYTLVVAEDEPLIRKNIIKKILQITDRFTLVGEALDGQSALEIVRDRNPDLLITDIRMPVLNGLELIREVYYAHPHIRIIVVSGYDNFEYAQTALKYGVQDYILKPINKGELEQALSRIMINLDKEKGSFKSSHPFLSGRSGQETLASNIAEYMLNHYAEELSLTRLSESFRVNPTYLTRIFKKFKGKAPIKYLQELRLNEAKRLLKEYQDLGIKEIAAAVGYMDQSYFSRAFKKHTGLSPQDYRLQR